MEVIEAQLARDAWQRLGAPSADATQHKTLVA
jgi:hypothetical protein